jgi:hypothetical protein
MTEALQEAAKKASRNGPEAVNELLDQFRDHLQSQHAQLKSPPAWTSQKTGELQQVANLIRRQEGERSVSSVLLGRVRKAGAKFLGMTPKPAAVNPHLVRKVQGFALLRVAQVRGHYERKLLEHFLGSADSTGLLDDLQRQAREQGSLLAALHGRPQEGLLPPEQPHEILLVRDLDDSAGNSTVFQLLHREVKRRGCSPAKLAELLRRRGLRIQGRRYRLNEWGRFAPAVLQRHLAKAVARYLTPALEEAAAELHLLHPAFQERLKNAVASWQARARFYLEIVPLSGVEPQDSWHLYCYPAHRKGWLELLGNMTIVPAQPEENRTNAFVAILLQSALALAPAALKRLPAYVQKINEIQRDGKFPVLVDPEACQEIRRLDCRPTDFGDVKELFGAAQNGGVVHPLPTAQGTNPRFALGNPPESLIHRFAPFQLQPQPLPASAVKALLREGSFLHLVEVTFGIADIRQRAQVFLHEHDDARVAQELCTLGIFQASQGSVCHYQIQQLPKTKTFPQGLYTRHPGPLVGLSEAEFLAALLESDELYSFVACKVLSAFDLNRLTANDLPAFLRAYAERRG